MKKITLIFSLVLIISTGAYTRGQKTGISLDKQFVPGRVLIKLKAQPNSTGTKLLRSAQTQNLMQKIGAVSQEAVFSNRYATVDRQRIGQEIGLDRWVAVTVPVVTDIKKLISRLQQDPNVEIAEPDYLEKADAIPNDTCYSLQQHLPQIKAQEAWDIQKGDSSIIIAILDTGVDWDHPDLASVIWNNLGDPPGGGDDDGNGYVDDTNGWDFVDLTGYDTTGVDHNDDIYVEDNDPMDFEGHGTHVAGIAAAVTDNITGIASISWGCKIMPLRIGYRDIGGGGVGYNSWMARAFLYAANNGAAVANLSFSTSGTVIVDAARYAFRNGVVVCNSAGNSNNETPGALGTQPWVLKIASVNDLDQKASYSSYGTWVNISAPGGDLNGGRPGILSTIVNPSTFYGDELYVLFQGTSMASPLVAGLAGLVKSRFKPIDAGSVVLQICATADNIDVINPPYAGKLGYGRINAQNAVTAISPPLKPSLAIDSVLFSDELGNNNGIVDPGETINMTVYLRNEWDDATNTTVTISTTDWGINITKSFSSYGTIPGIRDLDHSTKGNASDKFIFIVNPDSIPRNANIMISIAADQGYTRDFNLQISVLPDLLFVDDDDGMVNVEQYYTNAFDSLNFVYNTWDRSKLGPLTASRLSVYKTVVWGCEWAFPSLDSADRNAIGGFIDNGRQFFILGQDIGWDLCDSAGGEFQTSSGVSKTWYEDYFKTQYQNDDAGVSILNGISGDPIGDGLSISFFEPFADPYPEVIAPLSGAYSVFEYSGGGSAATRYDSTYKLVYFGFGGFEAITSESMRDTVMNRIFGWFNGFQLLHTPLTDTDSPDSQQVQVKVVSASNIESVNLYWDTSGTFPLNKIPMQSIGGGFYEAYIPGLTSATVQYTIIARTASGYMPYTVYTYHANAITGIEEIETGNGPRIFALQQNFPNPFNPTAIINYQLPGAGKQYIVSLRVYDMLGREVATLVNGTQEAGYYTATFDGSKLSSGIYFYRLKAGNYISTRKMLLIK